MMITLLQATDIISTIIYDCLSKSMLSLLFLWLYLFPDTVRDASHDTSNENLFGFLIIEERASFENSKFFFGNL